MMYQLLYSLHDYSTALFFVLFMVIVFHCKLYSELYH